MKAEVNGYCLVQGEDKDIRATKDGKTVMFISCTGWISDPDVLSAVIDCMYYVLNLREQGCYGRSTNEL